MGLKDEDFHIGEIFPSFVPKRKELRYNALGMAKFSSFNLSPELVNALAKCGYVEPSPVQLSVIPRALEGKSLLCQSETGSGKTHAYLAPMLERIDFNLPKLQGIVICPSRELARQVYEFAFALGKYLPKFKVRLFSSETETSQNKQGLSQSPHLVIGTPGRLKEMLASEYELDLHSVRFLVLDEADMLMDLGYFDEIDALYALLPEKTQTMVFSATLEENLKVRLARYVDSSFFYTGGEAKTAVKVNHRLVDIKHQGKFEALTRFLNIVPSYLCLVFVSKKEDIGAAYEAAKASGKKVIAFSGDLSTRERKTVLRRIKADEFEVVVCSDLLARGIDIENVDVVVSLDLPTDLTYYYHRAGRSGRFGKTGDSYVFYNADSTKLPKVLISQGTQFDFLILKDSGLVEDPVGLLPKKKFTKKKAFDDEQAKEVKKAKALSREDKVKPGYKKRQKEAVEKVKRKFRRKAIREKVRKNLNDNYRKQAKKGK